MFVKVAGTGVCKPYASHHGLYLIVVFTLSHDSVVPMYDQIAYYEKIKVIS